MADADYVQSYKDDIVTLIYEGGHDLDTSEGQDGIIEGLKKILAKSPQININTIFLVHCDAIDCECTTSHTLLSLFAKYSRIATFLLTNGASPNVLLSNDQHSTILHRALDYFKSFYWAYITTHYEASGILDYVTAIELMLAHKADPTLIPRSNTNTAMCDLNFFLATWCYHDITKKNTGIQRLLLRVITALIIRCNKAYLKQNQLTLCPASLVDILMIKGDNAQFFVNVNTYIDIVRVNLNFLSKVVSQYIPDAVTDDSIHTIPLEYSRNEDNITLLRTLI